MITSKKKGVIMADKTSQISISDTLFLFTKDYKIVSLNDNILDVEITNNQVISLIKNVKYSVIKIELQEGCKIAKGNDLLSSFVPNKCDYFYPLYKGYILFVSNRINFRKIGSEPPHKN